MHQYRKESSRSIPYLQIESATELQSSPIRKSVRNQTIQYDDPDLDQSISVWERNRQQARLKDSNLKEGIFRYQNHQFAQQAYPILKQKYIKQYQANNQVNCEHPKNRRAYYDQKINKTTLYWRVHVLPQVTQLYQEIMDNEAKKQQIARRQKQSTTRKAQVKMLKRQLRQKQHEPHANISYINHSYSNSNQQFFTADKNRLNQANSEINSNNYLRSQTVQTQDKFLSTSLVKDDKKTKNMVDINNAQSHQRLITSKKTSVRNSFQTQLSQRQYQSKISKLQGQNESLKQELEYLRQTLLTKFQLKQSSP